MAVIASFTAVPSSGLLPPSESVQFTDTSTGSPDNWLWDFGDGEVSNEQHPEHTFTGSIGQVFTVKLIAWIGASALVVGLSHISPKFEWTPGPISGTPEEAWDLFDPPDYNNPDNNTGPVRFRLHHSLGDNWGYSARRDNRSITLPASPSGGGSSVFILEANISDMSPGTNIGTVISDIGGTVSGSVTPGVWYAFYNMTDLMGTTFPVLFTPTDYAQLPEPPLGESSGIDVEFRGREYTTASEDDYDEVEGQIAFGTAPVAGFTGSPLAGGSPLSVQFENLSTPATGLPTTYSWKKRLSGSEDSFVEFSTEENPLHTFTK